MKYANYIRVRHFLGKCLKIADLLYSMARRGKTLKEVILEVLSEPRTLEETIKLVKSKKPRTKPRVIKALITRLKKEGLIKEKGGKLVKA